MKALVICLTLATAMFGVLADSALADSQAVATSFASGGVDLRAFMHLADGSGPKPTIVALHGNPGAPVPGSEPLNRALRDLGFNVLEFNYRGVWGMDGQFSLQNAIEDFRNAVAFLRREEVVERYSVDPGRISVVGYSFGSSTALNAASGADGAQVEAIVALALCDHGYFGKESMNPDSKIRDFIARGVAQLFGENGVIKQPAEVFVGDLQRNADRYSLPANAQALRDKQIHALVALDDRICPIEDHALPLYRALGPENMHLDIRPGGHGFENLPREQMAALFAGWIHGADPQNAFFQRVASLCGTTFEGFVPEDSSGAFAGESLVATISTCTDQEIRVSFDVGEDRSRTWILTRTPQGLRLKHDHREKDGTPDEITNYGGDTASSGSWTQQVFPADAQTASMIPEAATNVWMLTLAPDGRSLTYRLERHGKLRFEATLLADRQRGVAQTTGLAPGLAQ